MTKPKFTPGPWEFGPDANEDEFPIVSYEATGDGDEVEICQVNTFMTKNYESPGQLDMDRVIANARLIAAAPEMYALLKKHQAECGGSSNYGSCSACRDRESCELTNLLARINGEELK